MFIVSPSFLVDIGFLDKMLLYRLSIYVDYILTGGGGAVVGVYFLSLVFLWFSLQVVFLVSIGLIPNLTTRS